MGRMKLERYLAARGMTDGQLAALAGCTPATICRLRGKDPLRTASLALSLAIERATRGEVRQGPAGGQAQHDVTAAAGGHHRRMRCRTVNVP